MQDTFFTIPEVARRLRISRSTAYLLAERGELPVLRLGKLLRVPESALEVWVRDRVGQRTGRESR
jgi:excisionase family DNA binding protein